MTAGKTELNIFQVEEVELNMIGNNNSSINQDFSLKHWMNVDWIGSFSCLCVGVYDNHLLRHSGDIFLLHSVDPGSNTKLIRPPKRVIKLFEIEQLWLCKGVRFNFHKITSAIKPGRKIPWYQIWNSVKSATIISIKTKYREKKLLSIIINTLVDFLRILSTLSRELWM